MFRGREMAHPERRGPILDRLAEDVGELGTVESSPKEEVACMFMLLNSTKKDEEKEEHAAKMAEAEGPGIDNPPSRRRRAGRRGVGACRR